MKRWLWVIALAIVLLLAGCGGGNHRHTTTPTTPAPKPSVALACPRGQATMGCSLQTEKGLKALPPTAQPPGALYPDVSVWQGSVNWPAVKAWQRAHGWRAAAIFKMGEYTRDSQAARNASQLRSLGFWRAGYWFLRATGCSHELSLIISAAHAFGVKVVVLDAEVHESLGYVACLSGPLKRAGFIVVVYTAPGTWPGGSNAGDQTWGAAYGPSRPCFAWGCHIVAWQFTNGQFGSVVSIPGLGRGDVSVNLGIESLGGVAKLICFGKHASGSATCRREHALVRSLEAKRARQLKGQASNHRISTARQCPVLSQRVHWYESQLKHHPRTRTVSRRRALHASRVAYRQRKCSTWQHRDAYFAGAAARTESQIKHVIKLYS